MLVRANEIDRAAIAFGHLALGIDKAAGTDANKLDTRRHCRVIKFGVTGHQAG